MGTYWCSKKKKINVTHTFATDQTYRHGHISQSYKVDDPQNLIIENLFNRVDNQKMFKEELESIYKKTPPVQNNQVIMKPRLHGLWVNFQKKYEFQPIHDHSGLFSFVIWMDIPYHCKDEAKLPFSNPNDAIPAGGNFGFVHSNDNCRSVSEYIIQMSPKMNGCCCIFPSDLSHVVYPFYTSDKDRISISGNIVFEMVDSSEQWSQQFPFIVSNT